MNATIAPATLESFRKFWAPLTVVLTSDCLIRFWCSVEGTNVMPAAAIADLPNWLLRLQKRPAVVRGAGASREGSPI